MVLLKYVLNNLGRKKKQTFFSLLCVAVSSFIVLADFSLLNAIQAQMKEAINEVMSGHITVYSSDNDRMNILESQLTDQLPFEWSESDTDELSRHLPGLTINQRIRIGALVAYEDETSYVHFHALELDHLAKVNKMLTFRQGRMAYLKNEIVISETIADDFHCEIGDTVLLVGNNLYDYMSDAIGVVSGIFEERGLSIFLSHNGFMGYETGREFAMLDDGASVELVINPEDKRELTTGEVENLRTYLGETRPGLRLVTWDQTVPLLYSIVKVWNGGGVITQIIFILFSLIILVTLTSLIVSSRRKEFGTLLAIGFTWNKVRLLVCSEYALLSIISVVLAAGSLQLILSTWGATGFAIGSKDMQSSLMTDCLYPFLYLKDILYVFILFTTTTIISVLISIRRIKKDNIHSLINN